jgi:hypothetical protein
MKGDNCFMNKNFGKIIAGLGTIFSIVGMILDKHSQQRMMKETIIEEVAKAVNNK